MRLSWASVRCDRKLHTHPGASAYPSTDEGQSLSIVERWRWVWVWMGDPNEADAASIPDMHWNDDPAWAPTGGHLEIGCHFQLLVDNLLDLSHAAYVHAGTIGDKNVAETPATTSRNQNEVTLERRVTNVAPPPFSLPFTATPVASIGCIESCSRRQPTLLSSPDAFRAITIWIHQTMLRNTWC